MSDQEQQLQASALIDEKLFEARSVFIFGEINQKLAQKVTSQLIALAHVSDDEISVYVNSPGGHVESGDSIHDVMRFIKPRVRVIGTGWVASAGSLIFLGAEKEDRYCLPNTRFLLHQPSGGARGQATDLAIQAKEIIKMRKRLNVIIAERTGQLLEKVEEDTERDYWMTADEAKDYGIVNKVIASASEL
ncbi:ATP-dependent Clp protease proteolytic subunit [Piscirickettsia salmonis]|uniref:ATP-dependent Clp protease proteolytic subunit n=1 Tax=Piscirickettsia salmonis TaxID=1238 RepID=UPI0007C99056|nr:ATP-dependent Clp protease proteolytic subunit [Piscirickettsiaceae bacterium NZ-RLO1]